LNTPIRLAVWLSLASILLSGIAIAKRAYGADNYKTLSHEFNLVYADLLIKKINTFHSGTQVILFLKDNTEVQGTFKGYSKYDDSVWIMREGHWFQDAFSVNELQDITISIRESI
jgi:hypothetical protein